MELKPGYQRTALGIIPDDWNVLPLGSLAQTSSGTTPARALQDRYYGNGSIPWVKTLDLRNSELAFTAERVTQIALEETSLKVYPVGTVVVAMYGGFQQIGRTGLLLVPAAVNQAITAIVPNGDALVSEFLLATLNYRVGYWKTVASSSRKDPNISSQDIRKFPIACPPPSEQRGIAEALSDVDALLGALDRLIAKKRDLKQAAMQQLLTAQTRLPGFTGEWVTKQLGSVAPLQRGFDLPNPQLKSGPYPVVYSNGILNHHRAFQVKAPGVVTGRSGTIGRVTFVEADYWPHNTSLWVTSFQGNHPKFVFYLYTRLGLERFATGSGVPTLNRNDVHSHTVSIPPSLAEQTAIAEVLSDMDAELAALRQHRNKTRALKQAMMQELLTGRTRLV